MDYFKKTAWNKKVIITQKLNEFDFGFCRYFMRSQYVNFKIKFLIR